MGSEFGDNTPIDRSNNDSYYASHPTAAATAKTQLVRSDSGGGLFSLPGAGSFNGISSINPYEDPAFGAYMRGAGVNEANLRAEVALRQNRLGQQLQSQQPVFAEQLSNGMRSIGDSAEGNGTFNGGRRIADQTQFSGDVARGRLGFQNDISNQQDDLGRQLATQVAALHQGAAEQALNARQNLALVNAQAGLYQ